MVIFPHGSGPARPGSTNLHSQPQPPLVQPGPLGVHPVPPAPVRPIPPFLLHAPPAAAACRRLLRLPLPPEPVPQGLRLGVHRHHPRPARLLRPPPRHPQPPPPVLVHHVVARRRRPAVFAGAGPDQADGVVEDQLRVVDGVKPPRPRRAARPCPGGVASLDGGGVGEPRGGGNGGGGGGEIVGGVEPGALAIVAAGAVALLETQRVEHAALARPLLHPPETLQPRPQALTPHLPSPRWRPVFVGRALSLRAPGVRRRCQLLWLTFIVLTLDGI